MGRWYLFTSIHVVSYDLQSTLGDVHKRQRKVMLPGFGGKCNSQIGKDWKLNRAIVPESKSYVPIFRRVGAEVCSSVEAQGQLLTYPFSSQPNGQTFLLVPRTRQQ